ncbi:hypothetical protein ACFSTC_03555 [Nonomuraea ferruginea]
MAAHIDKVFTVFDERKPDLKGINHAEMDRLLAFVGSDAAATKSLVEAEVQRMLSMVHESYRRDGGEQIEDVLIPEARFMGHILETRRLYLLAQAKTDEQVKEEMKGMINSVLSELTGPAGKFATRFGFFGDKAHEKLTPMAFEKLSALLVDRMLRDGMTTGSAMQQASNDRTMTMSMIETMMLSARIAHGQWSDKALEGLKDAPFATDGSPPTLKPLHEIMADPATFDVFIKWARWHAKNRKHHSDDPRGHGPQRSAGTFTIILVSTGTIDMSTRTKALCATLLALTLSSGCTQGPPPPVPEPTVDTRAVSDIGPYWCDVIPPSRQFASSAA